jgi:hypothetical protein
MVLLIYKTFIAYAGEDGQTAQYIHDSLGNITQIQPYKAENYPDYGGEFKQRIQREIIDSIFMVALLTEKGKNSQFVNQEIGFATAVKALRYKFDPRNKELPIIIPVSKKNLELKGFITKDSNDILFIDDYDSIELVIANIILSIRTKIPKGLEGKTLTTRITCRECSDKDGLPFEYEGYIPDIHTIRNLILKNEPLKSECPNCNSINLLDARTLFPINLVSPKENSTDYKII